MADPAENGAPTESEELENEDAEDHLPPEVAARRQAALARLRVFGDPALRTKAKDVTDFDDALVEGPHSATIALSASSGDPAYHGIAIPSVPVSIGDNDTVGVTVDPTSGLVTTESGGTAQFSVRLNSQPTHPVTIALSSSDTSEGTIGPPFSIVLLTFQPDATALNPQTVTITGVNIHPSIAKGRMINAIRLAAMFLDRLPKRTMSPETTEGREGFIHPLTIEGGVAETKIQFILRSFDTSELPGQAEILREVGRQVEREHPGAKVKVETTAASDIDLYLQMDVAPTTSTYLKRAYTASGNETLELTIPSNGKLVIGVHGYQASSFTLKTSSP